MVLKLNRTATEINRNQRNLINNNWEEIEKNFNNVVQVVANDALNQVIDGSRFIWQTPVNSFDVISTTYPNPEEGWAVQTTNDGRVYRYSSNGIWEYKQQIDAGPVNALDTMLNRRIDLISMNINDFPIILPEVDDTNRIQRAIDFVSADVRLRDIYFTDATYKIRGDVINLKSNVSLIGINNPEIYTDQLDPYYAMIQKEISEPLENVSVTGFFFNQWRTDLVPIRGPVNPDSSLDCHVFSIRGSNKNINISDNRFQYVGVWCIGISDYGQYNDSDNINVNNNNIKWRRGGNVWYDASAIYVESTNHFIRQNKVETIRNNNLPNDIPWRITGGLETHGQGVVEYNTVINAYAGINVVDFAVRPSGNNEKRVVAYNELRGIGGNGIWLWMLTGTENLDINNNNIEMIKSGPEYVSNLREGALQGIGFNAAFNGYLRDSKIYNNKIKWTVIDYTGSEINYNQYNTAGINLNSISENVDIFENELIDCPYAAIGSALINRTTNDQKNIIIRDNKLIDCGWGAITTNFRNVFFIDNYSNFTIRNNQIIWINRNTTESLLTMTSRGLGMKFLNNEYISRNGFNVTSSATGRDYATSPDIITDIEFLRYLRNDSARVIPRMTQDRTNPPNNLRIYKGDVILEFKADSSVRFPTCSISGDTNVISAQIQWVDSTHVRLISGNMPINSIININNDFYPVVAVNMNGNIYKLYRSVPQFSGTITITNYLPTFI